MFMELSWMVPEGMHVTIPLVAVLVSLVILVLMCLYQSPAVKQRSEGSSFHGFGPKVFFLKKIFVVAFHRVKLLLRCLLPDKVPDPANSKWARECVFQPVPTPIQTETGRIR